MTSSIQSFSIHPASWKEHEAEIRKVRQKVFIEEQSVPAELEWDGEDPLCIHLLARSMDNQPMGTIRLKDDGKIGRLAVLENWRAKGVGRALMAAIMARALAEGITNLYLDAQVRALGFYEKFGFVARGPVFDDAGIDHKRMVLEHPPLFDSPDE